MKYEKFCNQIIDLVGGKDNIQAVVHCMTRLRFTLKDRGLAKPEELKKLEGVIDVVANQVAFQIIVGTHVPDVHAELIGILGLQQIKAPKVKKNPVKAVLDLMSESMTPLLEPFMAAGLIAGIMSILVLFGISDKTSTYAIFMSIKNSIFYFLPIFLAFSCAKRLGASPYLAVTLAAILLSNDINGAKHLSIFGLPLPEITYSSTIFPIFLGVWFMGRVNKLTSKIIPEKFHFFLKSTIVIIITLPATLILFGPIGNWIGFGLSYVCNFIINSFGGWVIVAIYAACQPLLIMLGAGNFIIPIVMNFYSTLKYDPVFGPAWMISDIAVCGALFGYFLKTKDAKQKQLFGTTSFSAFLGVTEPGVFGVFVKFRRPFIAVMIGGGLGGLFAGLMKVKAYAIVGLTGIPTYIGNQDYHNFYMAIISVGISFLGAMIASYLLGIPSQESEKKEQNNLNSISAEMVIKKSDLSAPVKGTIIPLNEIKDKAFSTGALGKGIGVLPMENTIKSPVDGEVISVFPTKHAIGLKAEHGIEILIHVGIDTVELNGQHFESLVKSGQKVKKGQPIINADFKAIKKANYDPTVILVITNTSDYLDVLPAQKEEISENENCLSVVI